MSEANPSALSISIDELKRKLEEILARPKVTRHDAEEAVEAAQAIADLMRAEERALRLIDGGSREAPSRSGSTTGGTLAGLTLHEAARRVLQEAGWPMHARDLAVRIKAGGWRHPRSKNARPDQIVFQLAARLPRYPEIFRRVAPNTFALAEWGDSPPRTERPQPRFGLFTGPGGNLSEWIGNHPEAPFEGADEPWPSS